MKDRILKGWTFMRIIYLLLGAAVLANGIAGAEWPGILFGAYIASMGIFGFGCAGGGCFRGNCEYPAAREKSIREEQ